MKMSRCILRKVGGQLKRTSEKQGFVQGAMILMIGTMTVKMVSMLFKIPISNLLGGTGYSYFTNAYEIFNLISTIATAGFPVAISKLVSENGVLGNYRDNHKIFRISRTFFLITGLLCMTVMILGAGSFAAMIPNPGAKLSIICLAPAVLTCCLMSAYRGYYQGMQNMYPTSISQIIEAVTKMIFGLGLSGGVDSSVAAVLLNRAIGKNLTCIFVDHGMLRKNEFKNVLHDYECLGLNVIGVDASQKFFSELAGVEEPEKKRKIIGKGFIDVFDEEAHKIKDVKWLAQGTIYPDCIESLSITGTVIKSHHNVGGLPEKMNLKLCEPLRLLFKDEVRHVGRELGMPEHLITRHPFPGPGLAVRILGDITPEKVRILQDADDIYIQGLRDWKVKDSDGNETSLYHQVWQAGVILLPVQSVGVMGDERTYERAVALRAVTSTDAMTADWAHLPYEFMAKVSNDIINKVKGVNRVCYDISSKPPATIEWE